MIRLVPLLSTIARPTRHLTPGSPGRGASWLSIPLFVLSLAVSSCKLENPFQKIDPDLKSPPSADSNSSITSPGATAVIPDHIEIVSGNLQSGTVGTRLSQLLQWRAIDQNGDPIANAKFRVSAISTGGRTSTTSMTSDSNGLVRMSWTLGGSPGSQTLTVTGTDTYTGSPKILTFTATASAGSAAFSNSSISASGPVLADGADSSTITIQLRDAFGNAVVGVTPTFSATNTNNANTYGACSSTNSSGVSTCSMASGFAEWKAVSLRSPITKAGNIVLFYRYIGTKAKLEFSTTAPSATTAGATLSQSPTVRILDTRDRLVSASDSITIGMFSDAACTTAITTTPSGEQALTGTKQKNATAGVAVFNNLSINRAGMVYLKATSGTLSSPCSSAISVGAGAASASQSSVTVSSASVASGSSVTATLTAKDAFGNPNPSGIAGTGSIAFTSSIVGGTGTFGGVSDAGSGIYTADFTGILAGVVTIGATISSAAAGTSASLTVTAGTATKLAFTAGPSGVNTEDSVFTNQPVVTVQDAQGNTVTGSSAPVTLAIGSNPGSASLAGAITVNASNGIATFSGLYLDESGTGYTLTAASPGLTSITSASFDVEPSSATNLVFSTEPSTTGTAGSTFGIQPVIRAHDNDGATVTTYTGAITLSAYSDASCTTAISSTPNGSTPLGGTLTLSAIAGESTFSGLSARISGTVYLKASASGLSSACSGAITVAPGTYSAAESIVELSAGTVSSGSSVTATLTTKDAYGNLDPSGLPALGSIAFTSSIVGGTGTFGAVSAAGSGVYTADFTGVLAGAVTIGATISSVAVGTSANLTVNPGPATKLAFTTEVSSSNTAGASFGIQPVVTVQDAAGNTVTSSGASVDLVIGSNPGAGTLSGTATVSAVNGVATFSGLSINKTGTGYTLMATSAGLTDDTSSGFNVISGAATTLAITTQPSGSNTAGSAFGTQPVITVLDAEGNTVTGSTAPVTLTIDTNPGSGTLSGTATVNAVNGVATFSGLSINKTGTGYTLQASSTGLTDDTSTAFDVVPGAAASLAFTTEPASSATAGTAISTQPVVTVQDAQGNIVTGSSASIALSAFSDASCTTAIATTPNGSNTLDGTLSVSASSGVASFSDVTANRAGPVYLKAVAAALVSDCSSAVTVEPGVYSASESNLALSASTVASGSSVTATLSAKDQFGNSSPSGLPALGSIGMTSSSVGGTGTFSAISDAGSGVYTAQFTGVVVGAVSIDATISSAVAGASVNLTVTPGSASKLTFTTSPSSPNTAGAPFGTQPVVTVQDAEGNTVTGSNASIALAIGTNPGSGTLSGTATVSAVNGVATFSGLSLNKAGTGYTLTASSAGLTSDTSAAFDVVPGAPSKLTFVTEPSSPNTAGADFSTQPVVAVQDAEGNTVTGSTASITLAIDTNPSSGTLSGTATVNAVNGVATFSGLSINKSGTGYTLTVTSAGLTDDTSSALDVNPGPATTLAFTTEPANSATAGATLSTQPVVTVQDAEGNTVSGSSASIALSAFSDSSCTTAISTTPDGSTTLGGTVILNASSGVAGFAGISANRAGTVYLKAEASGLATDCSSAISVTPGAYTLSNSAVTLSSSSVNSGSSVTATLTAKDAYGNLDPSGLPALGSIAFTSSIVGGTGTFGAISAAGSGVYTASFTGAVAGAVTIGATISSSAVATSANLTVNPGTATKLAFTTEVSSSNTAGAAFATQPVVTVQDAEGNTVTSSGASVDLVIGSNPGTGTLSGTSTVNAVNGVATFSGLSINKTGTGYTLTAASAGLTDDTSSAFDVTPGTATTLAITTQPSSTNTAGTAFATQPVVTVLDAEGNTVTGSTAPVTLAIDTNPSAGTLSGTATVSAVNGVATFSGLSINKTGTGYTLRSSSTGLTDDTSTAFDVVPGAAVSLAFTTEPASSATAGASLSTQPVVTVMDAGGNTVSGSSANIELSAFSDASCTTAIATTPNASNTLDGTLTVNASSGVATFTGISANRAGSVYLKAVSASLASDCSSAITVAPGAYALSDSAVTLSASTVNSGSSVTATLTTKDSYGNANPSGLPALGSIAFTSSIVGGTGSFGTVSATGSGVYTASFTGAVAGAVTIGATISSSAVATSANLTVNPGTAAKLAFTTQPSSTNTAGSTFGTQPLVTVQDAEGNTVTSSTASVTIAIGTNADSGTLSGTATVNAVNGVATFSDLSINKTGTGYTLAATSSGLTGATSSSFDVIPGSATTLAITTQPSSTNTAGTAFATQPVVTVQDAQGNTVTSSTASVTIAIGTNAGSGALSGTATISAVSGVATFSGLSINKTGTGYTLAATSSGLTGATSSSFTIQAGAASALAFTTEPGSNATAGASLSTQPVVTVQDAEGNTVTGSSASIALSAFSDASCTTAIATTPNASNTLSGTTTRNASSGVATFTGISANRAGTVYLKAEASGLAIDCSSAISVTPGAYALSDSEVTLSSSTVNSGSSVTATLTTKDAYGNANPSGLPALGSIAFTSSIVGGTGSFGAVSAAGSGVYTVDFTGVLAGAVTIGATVSSSAVATSANLTVNPGTATKLAFTTQPSGSNTAGSAFASQPVVTVQDAEGNTVTSSGAAVTIAIGTNAGSGALSGTATVNAVNGIATFSGLSINKTGTGYTLTTSSAGLTDDTGSAFDVIPGTATTLAITTQPSGSNTAGSAFGTQPVITVRDAQGNTVTGSSAPVTLTIDTNPGSGTLSGTVTVNAVNGVATFSGLSINKTGTGYTLSASSAGLTDDTSTAFDVVPGAAASLAFTTEPASSATAGASLSTQPVVAVQDAQGNIVMGSSASIALSAFSDASCTTAIATTPNGSNTLSGSLTVSASSGVATFTGISANRAGSVYLKAETAGLATDCSTGITVSPGAYALSDSAVTLSSSTVNSGSSVTATLTTKDAYGNSNPSGLPALGSIAFTSSSVGGTGTFGAVSAAGSAVYTASFTGAVAGAVTIGATISSSAVATSANLTVNPGTATKLAFTTQPSGSNTAGAAFATQPVVTVQDAEGNTVTSSTASVTIAIGTNVGSGTLSGTATVNAVNGIATFSGLSINKTGTGYTLAATSSGLTGATSSSFDVIPGSATTLAITTEPSSTNTAGTAFATQPVVTVLDADGNTVTGSTASITLAIGTNPGSGTLSGTATVNAVNGVATFSGLSINKSGTGYTLAATSSGLTGATSSTFTIQAGAASTLAFTTEPGSNATAGASLSTQPVVTVQDAQGNTITGSTASIALSAFSDSSCSTAIATTPDGSSTLEGSITLSASSGVASFSGVTANRAGSVYLKASTAGLATDCSTVVTVAPGAYALSDSAVTLSSSTVNSGSSVTATLTTKDAYGNLNPSGLPALGSIAFTSSIVGGTGTFGAVSTAGSGVYTASFTGAVAGAVTIGATISSSAVATSANLTVNPGAATKLAFTTEVSGSNTAGAAFATQPVVTVQDAEGNTVTSSTASVTIAIGTNAGSGTLSGTATVSAVNGVATFSGLSINKTGTGYTLSASSAGLSGATSSSFTIDPGEASVLVFTTQPSSPNTAATAFGTQPVVTIQDAQGNTVTSSTASITLAIGTNPGSGSLSGTVTRSAVSGIATFTGLSINNAGTGYTLTASSSGLTGATSSSFNVTSTAAASLAFTTQPAGAVAGSAFTTQPVVYIRDSSGNTVTSGPDATATLTLSITSGTGTLSGTTSVAAVGGVASWSGLSINTIGSKTLQVSKSDLTSSGGGGALTANSNSFYNEVTATFTGWTGIKAMGARTPAAGATDLSSAVASVTLTWSAVTLSPTDTISSYNIYRSTSSGGQNYASPLATGISASTRTYTDSTVTGGTTYYYTIAPVVSGSGSAVEVQSANDKEIKIIVPPANMALVHRWAANREMCEELMGKTSDRTSNYRCSVATGANAPPGTGNTGFFDLGYSLFVDAYGEGCNYTATNTCTDSTVNSGAASACIGIRTTPVGNVTAPAGSIYYSRQNAKCYVNTSATSGTSWTEAGNTTTANRKTMGSASPGLPPMVWVGSGDGNEVCSGQTVSGFSGTKRIPRRKEQILFSAWDSSLTHATIASTENSTTSLLTTNGCNTNSASGLTFDNNVTPTSLDTLPVCLNLDCSSSASTLKQLRIGSTATSGCVSRYGVQDIVGNVMQWVSDQVTCTSLPCTGRTSTTDTTNDDLTGVLFDGTQGPNTSNLLFSTNGRIQFPLGIPIISASFAGDGVVTWSGSGTANEFHGDRFYITSSSTRGMVTAGYASGTYSGTNAGRYMINMVWADSYSASSVGFRCVLQAD